MSVQQEDRIIGELEGGTQKEHLCKFCGPFMVMTKKYRAVRKKCPRVCTCQCTGGS